MAGRVVDELKRITRDQSRRMPVEPSASPEPDPRDRGHPVLQILSVVAVIVLVVVGWLVVRQLQADSRLQDCVMSGRRNCVPVDTGGR